MFLGVFRDFKKLLNKKVVPLYLWFFLYSFTISIESNFFICSYLKDEVFGKDENTFLVLIFYIIYSMTLFYINKLKKKNFNNNSYSTLYTNELLIELITLKYKLLVLKFSSIKHIFSFNFKKSFLFNIFLLNNYKSYKINTLIIFIINSINSNFIIWYPIYKTYSIFGYYKSTRLNYIDIKNENLKRIKH